MDWAFFSKWTGAKNRKMTEIATFYSKKNVDRLIVRLTGSSEKTEMIV